MDKDFFQKKIQALTDGKLLDLLQKTNNEFNQIIFELAKAEALSRNLTFDFSGKVGMEPVDDKLIGSEKLRKWNWGAFLLGPLWTLANRLEIWTLLLFVPFGNVYLAYHGNRLAFAKCKVNAVDDFLVIQKYWLHGAVKIFCLEGLLFLINCIVASNY
jgi:hypothetical protein